VRRPGRGWGEAQLPSRADKAGVEGTGERDVGCASDDGAAIGEEGEGEGAAAKPEQEVIGAEVVDVGMAGEAGLHGGEIQRAVALVDLDGVSAAESDVRAALAGEVREDATAADGAGGVGGGGRDLAAVKTGGGGQVPQIEGEQRAAKEVGLAGEEFESFGDLDGGGEVDGGRQNTGGVAGIDGADGRLGKETGEAGGGLPGAVVEILAWPAREDVHGGGVGADGGGVDPGLPLLDGEVIEKIAGLEVVGGVEDEICRGEEMVDVAGDEVDDVGVNARGGVEELDFTAGGLGLGQGGEGIGLIEEDLPLEIGGFDEVAVDQGQGAHPRASEQSRGCGTGCANADDGDVGLGEQSLSPGADAGEEDLAGVALVASNKAIPAAGDIALPMAGNGDFPAADDTAFPGAGDIALQGWCFERGGDEGWDRRAHGVSLV